MKKQNKIITALFITLCLFATFSAMASARSLDDFLPGCFTQEYIYMEDEIPYSLLKDTLNVELDGCYIADETGAELQANDCITTGCQWLKTQTDGDTVLFTYIILGDADRDGHVTAADARQVLRISSKLETADEFIDKAAMDINASYTVDASDARSILRYAAKMTSYADFSAKKTQNWSVWDTHYVLVFPDETKTDFTPEMFDAELVSEVYSVNGALFLKLKEPGRDSAEKLLYELKSRDDLPIAGINNPSDYFNFGMITL